MSDRQEPRFMINYETGDGSAWQDEYAWVPPQIGYGVVSHDGRRWRITDVWIVHPKRGAFEYGVHAFLSPAYGDDDLMSKLEPAYYGKPAQRP